MRAILFLFCAFISTASWSKSMNVQEFKKLSHPQQALILKEYKNFVAQYKGPELEGKTTSVFSLTLIEEAFAASEFNCFYAGWPSQTRQITRNGRKKSICTSPANANANYKSTSASNQCKSSELACNPTLFGSGLCVSVATQAQRNRAFAQCEQKFSSSGKSLEDVAKEISSGNLAAEADEMFQLVDNVCSGGFQSSTGMCRNLKSRVAAIVESKPEATETAATSEEADKASDTAAARPEGEVEEAPTETNEDEEEIEVVQQGETVTNSQERTILIGAAKKADEIQDAVQHTHTPACEDEHGVREPARRPSTQTPAPESLAKVSCEKPRPTIATRSTQELERILRENNVTITTAPISNVNLLWDFVAQLERFPASLRRELVAAGAKIHVFEDSAQYGGVTADPSWREKSSTESKDGRNWAIIPGTGGFVPNGYAAVPTRIVLNKLYEGHGASHLFLHEHGHTLNTRFGADKPLHNSREFQALKREPKWNAFMNQLCTGGYCVNDSEEAFAELFAYYHACDASQEHLKKHMPQVAEYFRNLTSVEAKRPR